MSSLNVEVSWGVGVLDLFSFLGLWFYGIGSSFDFFDA